MTSALSHFTKLLREGNTTSEPFRNDQTTVRIADLARGIYVNQAHIFRFSLAQAQRKTFRGTSPHFPTECVTN
jgi:hypothetical protein